MSPSFPDSSPVESGSLPIQVQRLYLLRAFFSSFEKKHHVVVWRECGHAYARHRVPAEVRRQLWSWVLIFPPWHGVSCSASHTKLSGIADMCSPHPASCNSGGSELRGSWSQGRVYSRSHLLSPLVSFLEMGTLLCSPGRLRPCGDPPASASCIWVYLQVCFTAPGLIVLLPKVFHPLNGTQSGMGQGESCHVMPDTDSLGSVY